MHNTSADYFGILQSHLSCHLQRRCFRHPGTLGYKQGHTDNTIAMFFDFGPQYTGRPVCKWLFQSLLYIVLCIQLINVLNLRRVAQCATTVIITGLIFILCIDAIAKMAAYGGTIIRCTRYHCTRAITALRISHDAVALAFRKVTLIHKLAFFDSSIVATLFQDLFQKEHRTFFELTNVFTQWAVLFEFHLLH